MTAINWADLQVAVAEGQPALTLLEFARAFIGSDPGQDDTLASALKLAGDTVETYADRVLAKRQVTDDHAGEFGTIPLRQWPYDPAFPVTVTIDGTTKNDYRVYTERGTSYLTRQTSRHDLPFDWRGYAQVIVTYTAGYNPVPVDLAQAITFTAMGILTAWGTGMVPSGTANDVRRETITGVGTIEYAQTTGGVGVMGGAWGVIPPTAAQLLRAYKRVET